jgi:hypothetical protein
MSAVKRGAPVATSGVRSGAEAAKPHQNSNQDLTWGVHRKAAVAPFHLFAHHVQANNSGSFAIFAAIRRADSRTASIYLLYAYCVVLFFSAQISSSRLWHGL